MNPIVSIIVPVYNIEKYLDNCIESILNQTFKNIELILVDDGSKDNSGQICDKYLKLDERVHVIHQKNKGLSGARNSGICVAKGKYISFIDGDDIVSPRFCETMLKMLENSSSDFSVCKYQKFYEEEEIIYDRKMNCSYISINNQDHLIEQLENGFSACAKLYKREIFDVFRFCEGKIHEDIIFSADLAKALSGGVSCTEERLYYYRQNNNGIMANSMRKCSADRIYAGKYLLDVVKEKFPDLLEKAFKYGIMFPWSYVDGIFVHCKFKDNKIFLKELQKVLNENRALMMENKINETRINRFRMILFSYSLILYGLNAYIRLIRVYIYRIIGKDAYKDGHGI